MKDALYPILALVAIGLLVPMGLDACSDLKRERTLEQNVSAHLSRAQKSLSDGRPRMAEASYSSALALDPLNQAARLGLIRVQAKRIAEQGASIGKDDAYGVAVRLEAAAETDAEYATQYRMALGSLYQAMGDLQASERWYGAATQGEPNYAGAWRAQGLLFSLQGKSEEAVASFRKSIDLAPGDGRSKFLLGRLFKSQQKLALAKPLLQEAAEKLGTPTAWYELGDTLLQGGSAEQAFAALTQGVRAAGGQAIPGDMSAAIGVAAYRTKRYSEAVEWLKRASQTSKKPEIKLNFAVALQAIGNHQKAATLLNQILVADPLNVDANIQLIVSLAKSQKGGLAHQVGNRFLTMARNLPQLAGGADRVRKTLANIPMDSMGSGLRTPGE